MTGALYGGKAGGSLSTLIVSWPYQGRSSGSNFEEGQRRKKHRHRMLGVSSVNLLHLGAASAQVQPEDEPRARSPVADSSPAS
jgi:hypothetical protein